MQILQLKFQNGYITDEYALEQEVENEAFEQQGEIAYHGSSEFPTIKLGEYQGLTYYSQIDNRWKDILYTSTNNRTQTIGSSGCGSTSASMVVSSIKGTITPDTMSKLFVDYGYRSANNGTYLSAFRWVANLFDIGYKEVYKLDEAVQLLKNNNLVIASCGDGLFTTGGHIIVLVGIEGNKIKVYDPYLYSGKFNISTRRGKVDLQGNTAYVTIDNFREYGGYTRFFAYQNTHKHEQKQDTPIVASTYTRYVKVNTSLNVRSGAGTNYKVVGSLYNTNKVTIYETKGNWSRIGDDRWVHSDYLTDSNIVSTVGQIKVFKSNSTIYSKSNLSGTRYNYLPNTTITILENLNGIDKIKVRQTGRIGYVTTSVYK